jgi:hypothetical protein
LKIRRWLIAKHNSGKISVTGKARHGFRIILCLPGDICIILVFGC